MEVPKVWKRVKAWAGEGYCADENQGVSRFGGTCEDQIQNSSSKLRKCNYKF